MPAIPVFRGFRWKDHEYEVRLQIKSKTFGEIKKEEKKNRKRKRK